MALDEDTITYILSELEKTVKTVAFEPYTKIGNFAQKYRESAIEYFNQTTQFAQFPKYLFAYITTPGKTQTAKTLARINDIKAQSLKANWGEYVKMSLADQEAYFT